MDILVDRIDYDSVEKIDFNKYVAFASDLGLRPGHRPISFKTSMGNEQDFRLIRDDVTAWIYRQSMGCIDLTVYND